MAYWLFKQEPGCYSYADLERDGQTLWDGIRNNLARQNLRQVKPGDRIWLYHTGKEKAVIGEMTAVGEPLSDPNGSDPRAVAVLVRSVRRLLHPVSLERLKGDAQLRSWELFRLPRLAIVPVTEDQWRRVEELSKDAG
jgi:predicted RNA-binding protein with PUA-like domain